MTSKRLLITTTAVAALAAAPAGALAHGQGSAHRAVKLNATLSATRTDVADYGGFSGKADLLANSHNAKSSLHLRGMVPGATYTWAIVNGTDAATVCATGTPVAGLKYKRLKANGGGRANSTAQAKRKAFTYDATQTYAVVVYQTGKPTEALLCGVFKGRTKKPKPTTTGHGKPTTSTGSDNANSHAGDHPSGGHGGGHH